MRRSMAIAFVVCALTVSACDPGMKDSQQVAQRFFSDLTAAKGDKSAAVDPEHFSAVMYGSDGHTTACTVASTDGIAGFNKRWTTLAAESIEVGTVKPLDDAGVRNAVEVTASTHDGKRFTARAEFSLRINVSGGSPRGWVTKVEFYPSSSQAGAAYLGDVLCASN